MSLEILDRDVGSREKLEKLTFPQKVPLPFLYKKGATAVQCRAWMPEDAERLFKAWVEIADRELEHISQKFISDGVLDGHRVDWGYEDWLSGAKGFVSNLAAVLGWADPRVQRRVQWISLLQDRFAALAAPAIGRQFSEGATSKGEWIDSFDDRVSVQALDASCGMRARKRFPSLFRRYADWAPHSPCVYRVKITPLRSDLSLDLKFHRISLTVEVGAAFADGHFERPVFADLEETLSEDPSANSRNIRAYQSRTALFIGTREVDVSNPMQEPKAFAVQRALGANPEPAMMRIPEIYR